MIKDTSTAPYFDDFTEDKNFLRVLFRPSKAVQARELTQAQTILQNQIQHLGDSVFIDNSRVLGAKTSVNFSKHTLVVTQDSNANLITDLSIFLGASITDVATGTNVLATVTSIDQTNNALLLTYNGGIFVPTDTFKIVGNAVEYVIDSTHNSITASCDNGLIYTDGFFVHVFSDEIIVDSSATAQTSKHHIGFTIDDVLVDENADTSLTDNALGSYNFNAPGAHRLKRDLILSSYLDGNTIPTGFLASIIISNGTIVTDIMKEIKYSDILDVMARRTYDESGNYVTEEFDIIPQVTQNGNASTQLDLEVSSGKAYVFGYESSNDSPKLVTIDKSQSTKIETNSTVYTTSGPFFDIAKTAGVDEIVGTFDVENQEQILFYTSSANAAADVGANSPDISVAGTTPKLASMTRNSLGEVRLFTVDTQGLSSQFNGVRAIRGVTSGAIATIELYNGLPVLGGTTDTSMLFPVQEEFISDIPLASISYDVTKSFVNQTSIVGNVVTIAQTNAATDSFYDGSGKVVYVRVNGTTIAEGASGWSVDVGATIPSSLVLDLTAWAIANALTVNTVDVTIVCQRTLNERTKTLVDNSTGDVITTPATPILTLTGYDVTDVYEVSVVGHSTIPDGILPISEYAWGTGQTDSSYDAGSVLLSSSTHDVLATYTVKYKHFSHSATGDYFTVNSYAGIPWEDIQPYTTTSFGDVLPLTDVFDFRKSVGSLGSYPTGETYINFDFSFYLSRIDKLYIDRYGNFGTITGLPAKTPFIPADKSDVMTLSTINLHAQTGVVDEVSIDSASDKGYTMEDIKELEGRIASLEYYSSLNLLEQGAKDLLVSDGYGNNRFKNGIFVDGFSSHEFGDTDNPDYNCSMDTDNEFVHSQFSVKNHTMKTSLLGDSVGQVAANVAISDDKIIDSSSGVCTLDYTTESFISQNKASNKVNVNPYAVFAWNQGQVTLSPTSDFWYDDVSLPIIRKTTGSYAGVGTRFSVWSSWNSGWWGGWRSGGRGWRSGGRGWLASRRGGSTVRTTIRTIPTLTTKINDKVVDRSAIHLMRSRPVLFWGKNFRPNTTIKVFFDDVDVTSYCTSPSGLKTDSAGNIDSKTSPGIFLIPAGQFKTGTKQIILKDAAETTEGIASFSSTGILRKNQRTITSIRGVRTIVSRSTTFRRRWGDPIAESFLIEKEGGIFVSSIDLFFASKDDTLPISCEIVEMLAGQPTQNTIPLSYKVVESVNVQVSNDSSLPTTFEFESPIYLQDATSYAFVVKTNSVKYEMFYAKMTEPELVVGDNIFTNVRSGQGISKQPYAGVMFKSQNAETWSEDQNSDVKFVLNRCVFDTNSNGVVEFNIEPNTAMDLTLFSSNIHNITYQDTSLSFDYKFLNAVGYTPITDSEDVALLSEKVIAASPSNPMTVRATLSSTKDNVSPIVDITRASITEVLNIIGPVVDNNNVKHAGVYVSKSTSLITPAEDIKVIFDAKTPGGSSVNVYFKTTPYVARHATMDALATLAASRYDLLANRNVNIYWRDNVNAVAKKGGFIPTKIGVTDTVVNTSVWIKDIVYSEDLNIASAVAIAANVTKIFAVEGTLLDTIIPDWAAGTFAFGDTVFNAGGLWSVSNVAGTSTEPVGQPADWDLIPHIAITSAITKDPETTWRAMKLDNQPSVGANLTVYNEYTYVPDATPDESFKSFAVKVEMVSNNAAQVPEVSKLRVLAVT